MHLRVNIAGLVSACMSVDHVPMLDIGEGYTFMEDINFARKEAQLLVRRHIIMRQLMLTR